MGKPELQAKKYQQALGRLLAGKALALYVADLGWLPNITYDPLSSPRSDF